MNKFLELSSSPLMNLDHTYRYSGTKLAEPESLSAHVVDTIMMGMKIIDDMNKLVPDSLNLQVYLTKAVIHDLEEVITGDVPRPLKYHDKNTLQAMRDVADEVATDLFQKEFSDDYSYYYDIWKTAKDGAEGFILKIVDNLVVVHKVVKEVSLLNNYYMLRVAHEVSQYTKELRDQVIKSDYFSDVTQRYYLDDLLEDAIECMDDILEEHEDKLSICSHSMI